MNRKIALTLNVKPEQIGQRVDVVIAETFEEFSRSHLQKLIKEGAVKVNGKETKPKLILQGGEVIEIFTKEAPKLKDKAESIELDIIHQDQDL